MKKSGCKNNSRQYVILELSLAQLSKPNNMILLIKCLKRLISRKNSSLNELNQLEQLLLICKSLSFMFDSKQSTSYLCRDAQIKILADTITNNYLYLKA